MLHLLCALLCLAPQEDADLKKKMAAKKILLDFKDTPLDQFLTAIVGQCEVEFVIDYATLPRPQDVPISVKADAVPIDRGLRLALNPLAIDYYPVDGLVIITNRDGRQEFAEGKLAGPSDEELKKNKDAATLIQNKKKPVSLKADGSLTLKDAIAQIAKAAGAKIDTAALSEEKLKEKVSQSFGATTLRTGLRLLCRAHKLTFTVSGKDAIKLEVAK